LVFLRWGGERRPVDVARTETVEAELDAFIERRARGEPDPDELEPSYVESVRRWHERRRRELNAERYAYHLDMAERHRRTLSELVSYHEDAAAKLLEEK
jgi:hypothetical protein